jgi:two-component system response regulator AtoC
LWRRNLTVEFVENGQDILARLETSKPDVVILDAAQRDEFSTVREVRRAYPDLPVIVLSGSPSTSAIVRAMQSGANNVLVKPVSWEALQQAVDELLPGTFARVGAGEARQVSAAGAWTSRVERLLRRLSASDVPVLLRGETGSGKEVLARRIHAESMRAGEIFLKLNCAALPSELVESELFGYERGAFTGAYKCNPGKFELAHRGTILLDEIGDMDLKLQAKLLQVLQDQEFLPLGAKELKRVDVRVIAATHRDLEERVLDGSFREDLYYRLKIVSIAIPPLRERRDEIVSLASLFLEKHNQSDSAPPRLGPELRTALLDHPWPGNVRELENVMRSYLVLRDPPLVIAELKETAERSRQRVVQAVESPVQVYSATCIENARDRPDEGRPEGEWSARPVVVRPLHAEPTELATIDDARKRAETELIVRALNSTGWVRKRAAAALGMEYRAFLYRMKKLGIDGPRFPGAA